MSRADKQFGIVLLKAFGIVSLGVALLMAAMIACGPSFGTRCLVHVLTLDYRP